MSVTITRDEWLAEIERVMRQRRHDSDGMTSEELATAWGVCKRVALERLKMLSDRVVVGQRRTKSVNLRDTVTPTYKLVPSLKAAKKR